MIWSNFVMLLCNEHLVNDDMVLAGLGRQRFEGFSDEWTGDCRENPTCPYCRKDFIKALERRDLIVPHHLYLVAHGDSQKHSGGIGLSAGFVAPVPHDDRRGRRFAANHKTAALSHV